MSIRPVRREELDVHFPGRGQRVLMFHGFTSNPLRLKAFAYHLNRQGFDVTVPLLPGHGGTMKDLENMTAAGYLDFAGQTFSTSGNAPDHVIGFSLGSMLALEHCLRHNTPSAVLLSLPLLHKGEDPQQPHSISDEKLIMERIRNAFIHEVSDLGGMQADWSDTAFRPVLEINRYLRLRLQEITSSFLVIQGGRDTLASPGNPDYLQKLMPRAEVVKKILETSGHLLLLSRDRKEIYNMTVTFLNTGK